MTRIFLNTLYVGTQGAWLRLENDQVVVQAPKDDGAEPGAEDEPSPQILIKTPLHHIGSIVLFGRIGISTPLMMKCADEGRAVTMMTEYGRFRARVQGRTSGNILLREAQHLLIHDSDQNLRLCLAFVAGKLQNTRQVVLRAGRESQTEERRDRFAELALKLSQLILALPECQDVNQARGIEGAAAQAYFDVFDDLILAQRTDFSFGERSRRPPRDRVNALLSFLYSMWTNDTVSALEGVGLDPQLGSLHVPRSGRPSLALDLIEEFRSIILDRLCLSLINRKQIVGSDFSERLGGAVLLNDDGRKKVLVAYQKRKVEEVAHPLFVEKVPIGLLPHVQARILARHFRGDLPEYVPYRP